MLKGCLRTDFPDNPALAHVAMTSLGLRSQLAPPSWLLALTPPEQPLALHGALEKCPVCSCSMPGLGSQILGLVLRV